MSSSDKDSYSSLETDLELDSDFDLDLKSDINLNVKIDKLNVKIDKLNVKVDEILHILKKDVTKNTKKMSEHIDFIENVYESVKSPLGFICNTVSHYIGSTKYSLNQKIDYFKKLK